MWDNGKYYIEGFVIICYDIVNNIKIFKDYCLIVNVWYKKYNCYIIYFVCFILMF